ncbi:MAG: hypothetical protein RJA99_2221 [Pseudomonadota bacterium]
MPWVGGSASVRLAASAAIFARNGRSSTRNDTTFGPAHPHAVPAADPIASAARAGRPVMRRCASDRAA